MKLYLKSCGMHIKSRMQYPASFGFLVFSGMFIPLGSLFSIYILFDRFQSLNGFSFYEVVLCFSIIFFGFSISEMLFRGLDLFSRQIRLAGFDRFLVRPRSPVLQALCSEFEFNRIGRILISIWFVYYSLSHLTIAWDSIKFFVLFAMLSGSIAVYFGIFLWGAGLCFFTIEGLEIVNILVNGGEQSVRYPIAIYDKGFRILFTFVVPMAATNYYPAMYLLDKAGEYGLLYAFTPLLAYVFVVPCYLFWRWGVRNYKSTGN